MSWQMRKTQSLPDRLAEELAPYLPKSHGTLRPPAPLTAAANAVTVSSRRSIELSRFSLNTAVGKGLLMSAFKAAGGDSTGLSRAEAPGGDEMLSKEVPLSKSMESTLGAAVKVGG